MAATWAKHGVLRQELQHADSVLLEEAARIGARKIFIDGVGRLLGTNGTPEARSAFHVFTEGLHRENLTAALAIDASEYSPEQSASLPEESIADTVIRLRMEENQRAISRSLEIVKSRGHSYQMGRHTFPIIDGHGLQVYHRVQAPRPTRRDRAAAIISNDCHGVITSWNKGAERLYGYLTEEAIGQPITMLIPPDRRQEAPEILAQIMRGEPIDHLETLRVRKDESPLEVSLTISPIKDSSGHVFGAATIARDITERRRIEEHRTVLINELNHRVKNTLATVQSLASQTLRNAKSTAEAREALDARLLALAKAHDVLTRELWTGAGLNEVMADAIAAYSGEKHAIRIHAGGPDLCLRTKSALALSMAMHELATNAVKYGALSNGTGAVAIDWRITDDVPRRFRLRWTETGGPPVEEPRRRGFGSRLVEDGLAQDLGGEVRLHFEKSGLICTIDVPLSEVAGDDQPS